MYSLLSGIQLHYEVMGEGDPILLVHGWGGSLESIRALGLELSKMNKVIIVDLPGFGLSGLPKESWGVEEYAKILVDLLKVLKIDKVIYFGHSFGGALGLVIATSKPQIITKLILCNSALKRANKKIKVPLFIKSILLRKKLLRIWLYRIFFPNSDISKQPNLESNFKKIMQMDLAHLPELITIPTLILWGKQDAITPVAWAYELHEKIKNSKLKIFPNERHALPLRNPTIVADEILIFINS